MDEPNLGGSPESGAVIVVLLPRSGSRAQILYFYENLESADLGTVRVLQAAGFKVTQIDVRNYSADCLPPADTCLLVLFDIHERDSMGFRLCARIRAQWRGPIMVILQGEASRNTMHAFEAGCDMQLRAPFDDAELIARIDALLRGFYRKS